MFRITTSSAPGHHRLLSIISALAVAVAALAVFVAAATACVRAVPSPAVRVVTGADAGKVIHLHRGERLTVRLAENPSTGYGWRVVHPTNSGVLLIDADFFRPGACAPHVVGCPGTHTFRYREHGAGATHLTIRLFPPGSGHAVQTYRITVVGV